RALGPPRDRRGQAEGVGVVVVLAAGMLHLVPAPLRWPALEVPKLADQLRVVEEVDEPLGEQRFDLEVRGTPVEVDALERGVDVADPMSLEGLPHPALGGPLAVDDADAIGPPCRAR